MFREQLGIVLFFGQTQAVAMAAAVLQPKKVLIVELRCLNLPNCRGSPRYIW